MLESFAAMAHPLGQKVLPLYLVCGLVVFMTLVMHPNMFAW